MMAVYTVIFSMIIKSKFNDHWNTDDSEIAHNNRGKKKVPLSLPFHPSPWSLIQWSLQSSPIISFSSLNSSQPRSEEFNDGNAMISHKKSMKKLNDVRIHGHFFNDDESSLKKWCNDHWINERGDGP